VLVMMQTLIIEESSCEKIPAELGKLVAVVKMERVLSGIPP